MKQTRTFYYSKAQTEDFEKTPKRLKTIAGQYPYVRNHPAARFLAFVTYRIIATPIAFVYARILKGISFKNRQVLRPFRKTGYFIYANHTQVIGDALTPSIVVFPKRNYTVVSPANVSLPVLGNFTKLLGALPLPTDLSASKNFFKAVDTRISQGHSVLIYPEAHVWPNYTHIRPFSENSFKFPLKHNAPVFAFTTTYQKKKHGHRTVIYVDGPFFAADGLDARSQQRFLHDQVYMAMNERAKKSDYEKYRYLLKETL